MKWTRWLPIALVLLPALVTADALSSPLSGEMDVPTAALVLSLTGQAAEMVYAAQAQCAGLVDPSPLPVVRILNRRRFPCGQASPTGWCIGLHSARGITLGADTSAFAHELF